jgi:hypothetical protein
MEFPCPCCGHLVFRETPGSYEICPICFWEDDAIQLRWPDWAGGANRPSLDEAQRNFMRFGAMEDRFVPNVRPPTEHERLDEGWRPIDVDRDLFEPLGIQQAAWPRDSSELYYWRSSFWGLSASSALPVVNGRGGLTFSSAPADQWRTSRAIRIAFSAVSWTVRAYGRVTTSTTRSPRPSSSRAILGNLGALRDCLCDLIASSDPGSARCEATDTSCRRR